MSHPEFLNKIHSGANSRRECMFIGNFKKKYLNPEGIVCSSPQFHIHSLREFALE
jgi:hypothetical protein